MSRVLRAIARRWRGQRPPPPKPPSRHPTTLILCILAAVAAASFTAGVAYRSSSLPSPHTPLRGPAHVVDGDTLVVAGVTVRLKGVDAPESGQMCYASASGGWLARPRRPYDCGAVATRALTRHLRGRPVTCVGVSKDKYGRRLARCYARHWLRADVDVGVWLLDHGHAVMYGAATQAYREAELRAKRARVGVWGGSFEVPALWRAKREARGLAARVAKLKKKGKK